MYEALLNTIDAAIGAFVIDLFIGLSNDLTSTLRLMMILSITLYGLAMIKGWIATSLQEAIKHIFMAVIVYLFATQVGLFTDITYDLFTNAPNQIMGKVLSHSGGPNASGINTFIGNAYDQGIRTAADLMFGTGWSIGLKIMGTLVAAATIALCGYAGFLVVMSKIAVAVLLGLSPLFIAFLMFKTTRGLFEGWLRQLINFALIPLLTYAIMLFCLAIVATPINDLMVAQQSGNITTTEVMPYIATCFVSFLLLLQVMGIASGIAGGISLSTLGVVANRFNKYGALSVHQLKNVDLKWPTFRRNSIQN